MAKNKKVSNKSLIIVIIAAAVVFGLFLITKKMNITNESSQSGDQESIEVEEMSEYDGSSPDTSPDMFNQQTVEE